MPAVVTFWQLHQDEMEFVEFTQTTGTIVAIADRKFETPRDMVPVPLDTCINKHGLDSIVFAPAELLFANGIQSYDFKGTPRYGLSLMPSLAIGYSRGTLKDGRLPQSNLAAYWDYPDEAATKMTRKTEAFVKWAKIIFAYCRKATPERVECHGFPYRATRRVKAAVEAGSIEAVL